MARFRPLVCSLVAAAGTIGALLVPGGAASAAPATYVQDPASLVNPFIGTSNAVDDFPAADVPFGMVQWGPDTPSRPDGGGYEYNDKSVTGFSLTHISGPGCPAAGDIPILPTTGAVGTSPSSATLPLDHTKESASAGYYSLAADGITTQLTTTTRSGMGQFTFPAGTSSNLLFKLSGGATTDSGTHFQVISDTEVAGWVTSGQFCGASDQYTVYFDMQFNQPFTAQGTWKNSTVSAGSKQMTDTATTGKATPNTSKDTHSKTNAQTPAVHGATPQPKGKATPQITPPVAGADGGYVTFDTTKNQTVQAKVGVSYVSTGNAAANLKTENPGWNFNQTKTNAHNSWNTMLGRIQIGGGTTTQQTLFYTGLYHSLLHPNVFSDDNGEYMGFDGQIHTVAKGHAQYANYSGWDIYRDQVQLAAMVAPQQTSDSISSMINDYEQSGQLPKWALNDGESYVMVGDPADSIIADAYAFGAKNFDTKTALQAMLAEANQTSNIRPGMNYDQSMGYLPMDGTYGCCNFYGPVSTQLEYDTADHAISTFAAALGDKTDAATMAARAQNWTNVFNPGTGYMEPKYLNGQFEPGFTPSSSNGFVEADAAQYTPMVPFDIKGLAAAAGGNAAWQSRLDTLMSNIASPGSANADLSNEPSIEIPWEYDYVGAPYKTQEAVRQVQQQLWSDTPAGFFGNDDLGAMSSWYVWSELGMYPETPGSSTLALGSPVFNNTLIHLANNKTLTINAPQAATNAPYVQSLTNNGSTWSNAYLPPADLTNGGTLNYTLGTTPNTSWASSPSAAPPSDATNLTPALGYTSPGGQVIVAPGSTTSVDLGVRSMSSSAQSVSWTATATSGLTVGPNNGTVSVPAGGNTSQAIAVTTPTTEGRYLVTFALTSSTGAKLPNTLVEVDVAKPGSLWPYYNDAGVVSDGSSTSANYDGDGWAYSANQLAAQGITPGATITVDGLNYTFPDEQPGQLDNIEAGGQTITLAGSAGATKIGILGSATNTDPGSQGDFVVHFTDGTSQTIHFGLSDWTLGASSFPPAFGNFTAATTTYRDSTSGGAAQQIKTYLFTADASLTAGKTVSGITLPASVDQGQLHVFAFGLG
ncbi:MAG TPA: lectin [Pseudonocardiaceae bacterium]|nr:lectin [Pseudonocardiaceae bacterium]